MSENGPLVVRRDFGCKTGALQFRSKKCNLAESAMHLVEAAEKRNFGQQQTELQRIRQNSYELVQLYRYKLVKVYL